MGSDRTRLVHGTCTRTERERWGGGRDGGDDVWEGSCEQDDTWVYAKQGF